MYRSRKTGAPAPGRARTLTLAGLFRDGSAPSRHWRDVPELGGDGCVALRDGALPPTPRGVVLISEVTRQLRLAEVWGRRLLSCPAVWAQLDASLSSRDLFLVSGTEKREPLEFGGDGSFFSSVFFRFFIYFGEGFRGEDSADEI